jgi:hypothetical protein
LLLTLSCEICAQQECLPQLLALDQIVRDFGELGEGGLQVFDDFGGDDVGIGEIGAVFEAFVFEPRNIEVEFVALG